MDLKENDDLPFDAGQAVESRSFTLGFRGAWFRCKILKYGLRKGQMEHALEYLDFPDERITWRRLYQKPSKSKVAKWKLSLRPHFPPVYRESQMPDINSILEVVVIVDDVWKVGDLVDWFSDGCYWSGRITELLGDEKVKIELFPPPVGEGLQYEGFCEDLRPSLDWTPEYGWTVPIPTENGNARTCARIMKPLNKVAGGPPPSSTFHPADKGIEGDQAAVGASLECSASFSHISTNSSQPPDGLEQMTKQPLIISASKEIGTCERELELDVGDDCIGKASCSGSASSSDTKDASGNILGDKAGKGQDDSSWSSKKMKADGGIGTSERELESDVGDNCIGKASCSGSASSSDFKDASGTMLGDKAGKGQDDNFRSSKKMKADGGISLKATCSDPIEAAVMDLEGLVNRVKLIRDFLELGKPPSSTMQNRWKFLEYEESSTSK